MKQDTNGLAAAGESTWSQRLAALFRRLVSPGWVPGLGVVVYAIVGGVVAFVTFTHSAAAPDLFQSFAVSAVGWLLGSFAVVSSKQPD